MNSQSRPMFPKRPSTITHMAATARPEPRTRGSMPVVATWQAARTHTTRQYSAASGYNSALAPIRGSR